jgi:hypothetical protein
MTNAHEHPRKVARTDILAIRRTDYDMELAGEGQAQFLPRKSPERWDGSIADRSHAKSQAGP